MYRNLNSAFDCVQSPLTKIKGSMNKNLCAKYLMIQIMKLYGEY